MPVCDPSGATQTRGKAYPSLRPLRVAAALGDAAAVGSICPLHALERAGDPLYGFRPLANRLFAEPKGDPTVQCLPRPLARSADGHVSCRMLVWLANPADETICTQVGLQVPDAETLLHYREAGRPLCLVPQLLAADIDPGSACSSSKLGWCYAVLPSVCPTILLSQPSPNATFLINCEEGCWCPEQTRTRSSPCEQGRPGAIGRMRSTGVLMEPRRVIEHFNVHRPPTLFPRVASFASAGEQGSLDELLASFGGRRASFCDERSSPRRE